MSTTKPLCLLTEVKDIAEHIGSFLKAPDLANLCQASKGTQLLFNKHLPEMALLKAVFDANPEQVQNILKLPRPPKSKCIVLTKTHIKETYFSPKLRKTGVKREWTNISSLEAAAWCGDIFLVRELLLHVPENQKHTACLQLKGILERKESEQNGTYLAPYRDLVQAYETHNEQFNTLYEAKNWVELEKNWHDVWQKQRLLPTYGLQEYCNDKPFRPLPSFTESPKRSCYLYNDPKELLDLDSINFGKALYKVVGGVGCRGPVFAYLCWGIAGRFVVCRRDFDLAAISHLCEVRRIQLSKLIKELEVRHEESSDSLLDERPAGKI